MTLELIAFNAERLARLSRACGKVREQFKTIFENAAPFNDPSFPVRGVSITFAEDGESISLVYQRVAIDLILTQALLQHAGAGRVTAMLVKHPLIKNPVELGSFTLKPDGETDLAPPNGGDERYVGSLTLEILMTLVEKAVYYAPTRPPTVAIGVH